MTVVEAHRQLAHELSGARLGDARLARRLFDVVLCAAQAPDASFPQMMRGTAQLEALYRLLNNPRVSLSNLLEPHLQATVGRARDVGTDVLVAHDTTQFCFSGDAERRGLGAVHNSGQGFFGHFALAFADDARRTPLGIVGLRTVFRPKSKQAPRDKESARWPQLVDDVHARIEPQRVIHLMDREADWSQLFSHLQASAARFVIRLCQDRKLEDEEQRLFAYFDDVPDLVERDVELGERSDRGRRVSAKQLHPARAARIARVGISAKRVLLHNAGSPLQLCVVRVLERNPPQGQAPVQWWLATSEPIESSADLLRVVDLYRARWLIEEFFKALKSGCRYQERQLESDHALLNALGILAPVAWQMLALRTLSRSPTNVPASKALTTQQLQVLRAFTRHPLPEEPTAEDALYAIAALGGHLRHNGPPGWATLAKGMQQLTLLEAGWAAAQQHARS